MMLVVLGKALSMLREFDACGVVAIACRVTVGVKVAVATSRVAVCVALGICARI